MRAQLRDKVKEQTGLGARWHCANPLSDQEPGKAVSPRAGGGFCRFEANICFRMTSGSKRMQCHKELRDKHGA
ncbi:hypothetical protein IAD21_06017 [Abditibacteriota bacterium]|nr:hypothetical protein IAD21_06017 [Abditibacteriota bacterium]